MDACGPGWHLQIARTTSDDGLANESLKSLSNCMLSDSTRSVMPQAYLFDHATLGGTGVPCHVTMAFMHAERFMKAPDVQSKPVIWA